VIKPKLDPLFALQPTAARLQPDGFGTLIHNYAGQASSQSPPDTTGDVGRPISYKPRIRFESTVRVIDKLTGANAKTFTMESLAAGPPCSSGYCDPVVM
jgi:hypothetical protein